MNDRTEPAEIFKNTVDNFLNKVTNNTEHQTNLTLDPKTPGVGGQLGGSFEIKSELLTDMPTDKPILVTITNHYVNKTRGAGFQHGVIWHKSLPAHCSITETGINGNFTF